MNDDIQQWWERPADVDTSMSWEEQPKNLINHLNRIYLKVKHPAKMPTNQPLHNLLNEAWNGTKYCKKAQSLYENITSNWDTS